MIDVPLGDFDRASICKAGWTAIDSLPTTRRIARFEWKGRTYRAVRMFVGMQIQSGDKRRLIVERSLR